MTLREILDHDKKSGLSILNPKADLGRIVSTIESTETPDVIRFVPADCFIITTGMIYKNNQEKLKELIRELDALPCAGLAIKLGRFIEQLEESVLEQADQLRFPLLLIPKERTLGQVYQNMLSILWDNQNISLLETLNRKKKLYNLVIKGATMQRMLRSIGNEIGRHILVADAFGRHYVNGNATSIEQRTGVEFVNRHGKELSRLQESRQYPLPDGLFINVYPINSISGSTNYLLMFHTDTQTPVSDFMMEEIVLLLEVILYKNLFADFSDVQRRDEFCRRLLGITGEKWSLEQLLKWDGRAGFRISSFYYVILCRFVAFTPYRFSREHLLQREEKYIVGYRFLKSELEEAYCDAVTVFPELDHWQYVIFTFSPCDGLENCLKEISDKLEEILGERTVFSHGGRAWDQESIQLAFYRGAENYEKNQAATDTGRFLDLAPGNVLDSLREIPRMQTEAVCRDTLKELAFPDSEIYRDLRRTLKVYLECKCSITETATALFLHRNTIRYRIRKCENILGHELSSAHYCFEVQLALYLSEQNE